MIPPFFLWECVEGSAGVAVLHIQGWQRKYTLKSTAAVVRLFSPLLFEMAWDPGLWEGKSVDITEVWPLGFSGNSLAVLSRRHTKRGALPTSLWLTTPALLHLRLTCSLTLSIHLFKTPHTSAPFWRSAVLQEAGMHGVMLTCTPQLILQREWQRARCA